MKPVEWNNKSTIDQYKISGLIPIGLCPGAEYGPAKRWPIDRFRKVMDLLLPLPIVWVLLGTAQERALSIPLMENFPGLVENLIGSTSLDELMRTIKELDLLLTNDTGSMHLAALFNIPTVALFGSTDPNLTGPQGSIHRVLRHPVECSPCFLRTCPIDFRCMIRITPEEVVHAITETISK
ncbi:MAG: glycosyltransferase family 9 protein [Chthoniobacterales bacterium]|nr:glycosyltransferase family 9 protein [Chthoniobacterales bacterium]